MKTKFLILSGLVLILCSAFAFASDPVPPPPDTWNGYPLDGEWLLDEQNAEYWYLHSDAEFDAPYETCRGCHPGWFSDYTVLCPDQGVVVRWTEEY